MRHLLLVLSWLLLVSRGSAQDFDVRVVDPPLRLGERGAQSLITQSFPGLRVVPTGAGELVLSGSHQLLDRAEALLKRLDRPARTVLLEFRRDASESTVTRSVSGAVNFGDARVPSTFLRTQGTSRGGDTRSLRVQEGSPATLFLGGQVPVQTATGPFTSAVDFRDVGRSVEVRVIRIDPGRGVSLDFRVGTSSLGAPTPAGPSFRQEGLSSRVYVPFGSPVELGGGRQADSQRTGGPTAQLTKTREGPLEGSVGAGRTQRSSASFLGYSLTAREVR